MPEETTDNPVLIKGSSERRAVIERVAMLRREERKGFYHAARGKQSYDKYLEGYLGSLDYVRELGSTNLVLDIGAGITRAAYEISTSSEGKDLNFEATTLTFLPKINEYLGKEKVHITPAEILRGVEDSSVGLALAVYSITYSVNPDAAIDSINRVLVPGGILKGVFRDSKDEDATLSRLAKPINPFEQRLRSLGYDIAIGNDDGILLAKKPGGNVVRTAEEILEADRRNSKSVFLNKRRALTIPKS